MDETSKSFQEQQQLSPINSNPKSVLQPYLISSHNNLPQQIPSLIKKIIDQYTLRNYYAFLQENQKYFQIIWNQYKFKLSQTSQLIPRLLQSRYKKIYKQILTQQTIIQPKKNSLFKNQNQNKNKKIQSLEIQSINIKRKLQQINNSIFTNQKSDSKQYLSQRQGQNKNSFLNYDDKQIKKKFQQKKKMYELEKKQRQKKIAQIQQKEQRIQAQKILNKKAQEQKKNQMRKEQIKRKIKQNHQKREHENQNRMLRNSQYLKITKDTKQKPPLYKRIQFNYNKRYNQDEKQGRDRFLSQRKSANQRIDQMKLEEHQKFYEKIKQEKQKIRKEKLQTFLEQQRSRIKNYSSTNQIYQVKDQKEQQKKNAKQKFQKMKSYQQIVKQKYRPKINEQKKRQLIQLIKQIQDNKKKYKKVQLKKGQTKIQQLKVADSTKLGMEYLEKVKQMALKYKSLGKRKSSEDNIIQTQQKKIDYLQQLRNNRPRGQTSRTNKMKFINKSNVSYDEKIKKVELQTQKLYELTKQKEQKLKYGKFNNSQQILLCKEEIDQNYMEIVRMKLKLLIPKDSQIQQSFLQ